MDNLPRQTTMRLLLFTASIPLFATQALAASEGADAFAVSLRLFWGLLIVCGILLIIYALARKKLTFLHGIGNKGAITVIEMRHLMPRKSLCLVKVRGQEYLLGLGNDQINLIAAIPSSTDLADTTHFAATLQTATAKNETTV